MKVQFPLCTLNTNAMSASLLSCLPCDFDHTHVPAASRAVNTSLDSRVNLSNFKARLQSTASQNPPSSEKRPPSPEQDGQSCLQLRLPVQPGSFASEASESAAPGSPPLQVVGSKGRATATIRRGRESLEPIKHRTSQRRPWHVHQFRTPICIRPISFL